MQKRNCAITLLLIAALGLAAGLDMDTIATLSNLAGGQVCEFPGVVSVRRDVLQAEYENWMIHNANK